MSLSPLQLLIILIIAVVIFGTAKFKNAGKDIGNAVKGFKDAVKSENDVHVQKPNTLLEHEHEKGASVDTVKVNSTDNKVNSTNNHDTQA